MCMTEWLEPDDGIDITGHLGWQGGGLFGCGIGDAVEGHPDHIDLQATFYLTGSGARIDPSTIGRDGDVAVSLVAEPGYQRICIGGVRCIFAFEIRRRNGLSLCDHGFEV